MSAERVHTERLLSVSNVSGVHRLPGAFREKCLMDALSTAVMVVTDQGRVLFANARAAEVLGKSQTDLVGEHVEHVLAPMLLVRASVEARADTDYRQKVHRTDSEGARHVIGFRASKNHTADGEAEYAIVFQDITQWERIREERDRALRMAAVGDVLPSVLHELKNPLAAVAGAVELMHEDAVDPEQRAEVGAVLNEIRRMKLTLEGINSVGRPLDSVRDADVAPAVCEPVRILRNNAEARGITITCETEPLPLMRLDTAVLRGIVFNLVTNALHACSPGCTVRVRATREARDLVISVTDDGHGMAPEVLERCRELFYSTKPRGSGIGLALCDRAARDVGGGLSIESTAGGGTTVTLRVPFARGQTHKAPRRS